MKLKTLIIAAAAAASFGAVAYAAVPLRRAATPVSRAVAIRAAYDPFALQRKATPAPIVVPPAPVPTNPPPAPTAQGQAAQARAMAIRVAVAAVRPPYRPATRSPYTPPIRGPLVTAARR